MRHGLIILPFHRYALKVVIIVACSLQLQLTYAQDVARLDSLKAVKAFSTSPKDVAMATYWIGSWFRRQYQLDSSVYYLTKAIRFSEEANDTFYVARSNHTLGSTLSMHGRYDDAAAPYLKASELYLVLGKHERYLQVNSNLGLNLRKRGQYDRGIQLYLDLIKYADSLKIKEGYPHLYNNIALIYVDIDKEEKAIEYYSKCLQASRDLDDTRGVALATNNLSIRLRHKKEFVASNELLRESIEVSDEINFHENGARARSNLGANYTTMGRYDDAIRMLKEAEAKYIPLDRPAGLIKTHWHLGEAFLKMMVLDSATYYAHKTLRLSRQLDIPIDIQYGYELLRDIALKKNDGETASLYVDSVAQITERIERQKSDREIARAESLFKVARLEDSLAVAVLQQEKLAYQKERVTWIYGAFLGAIILMGVIILYLFKRRQLRSLLAIEASAKDELSDHIENHRHAMGSFLHDEIGQQMALLKMGVKQGKSEKDLLESVDKAIEKLREQSRSLYPFRLKRLGLNRAIQATVKELNALDKTTFTADLTSLDGVLTPEQDLRVYRIIQEAFSNVLKHANAIAATAYFDEGTQLLVIKDNGDGLSTEEMEDGIGLIGMRVHAKKLMSVLLIKSSSTGVQLSVDLSHLLA
ncbi:MAG: tetratricopeptide repeat protein [Bacteroidota bacterium]